MAKEMGSACALRTLGQPAALVAQWVFMPLINKTKQNTKIQLFGDAIDILLQFTHLKSTTRRCLVYYMIDFSKIEAEYT